MYQTWRNYTRCPHKNKAVALLKQQATALFLLGHPVEFLCLECTGRGNWSLGYQSRKSWNVSLRQQTNGRIIKLSFTIVYSKDARLPVQLQRAMAAEAEAAREARAKVIAAEGEQKASKSLAAASNVMAESCAALQLRYLQVMIILIRTRLGRHLNICFPFRPWAASVQRRTLQ